MRTQDPTTPLMITPRKLVGAKPRTLKIAPPTIPPMIPRMILKIRPDLLFIMIPARNPHKPPVISAMIRLPSPPIMISFQDLNIIINRADYTIYSTCYQTAKIMFDKGIHSTYTILACVQRTYYALTAQ